VLLAKHFDILIHVIPLLFHIVLCAPECLDVLTISLDQSPLDKHHIPALFFLAETMLYWLRTDAVHQPYLRTGEIKLLKVNTTDFLLQSINVLCTELHLIFLQSKNI